MSTTFAPLLVRASAGTGKTYALAGRLLSILLSGAEIESVLATTFTRKAAGEILDRILVTLAHAAGNERALEQLREQVERPQLTSAECRMLLHRLIREIHRLRVCTLDSLFSQLARSFPFELRLPPGWRLSDEIEELWIRRRSIDAMLASIDQQELTTLLSMLGKGDSLRSIDFELQAIITDAYSISRWCNQEAWQTLPESEYPNSENIESAADLLLQAVIGHASANRMLQQIGSDLKSRLWDKLVGRKIIADAQLCLGDDPPLTYYKKTVPAPLVNALSVAYSGAKAMILGLVRRQSEATGGILNAYDHYLESIKFHARVMAFDDIAFRLARWMESIQIDELSTRMDGSLNHVLLDEFQDTSPVQWMVLRPLAIQAASSPPKTSFFCVGDTKQAIYGWRGGKAAIFDAVKDQIPGVQEATQNESFRSSPIIMEFVTELFQHIGLHPKFADVVSQPRSKEDFEAAAIHEFADSFPVHRSARRKRAGYVRLLTGPPPMPKSATSSNDNAIQQLQFIAQEVADLAQASPQHSIGVLTRTNRSVARLIFLLKRLGVDVSQEGGNPLTDSALVELVLSALLLSEHPGDHRWAYHVSHSPLGELLQMGALSPQQAPQDREEQIDRAATLIRDRYEYFGLTKTLMWLSDAVISIASEADVLRLRQLLSLAHAYERNEQPRLSAFVDLVRQKRVERPRPAQVRVMTVHQSKGLEFDSVVLPELGGNLTRMSRKVVSSSPDPMSPPNAILRYVAADHWSMLPEQWQQVFGENAASMMTEALCLLYVAVTRPRHSLHLIIDCITKEPLETRTPAALIYHALRCSESATIPQSLLYELGDRDWYQHPDGDY